jgi:hypothetical protein
MMTYSIGMKWEERKRENELASRVVCVCGETDTIQYSKIK